MALIALVIALMAGLGVVFWRARASAETARRVARLEAVAARSAFERPWAARGEWRKRWPAWLGRAAGPWPIFSAWGPT